MFPHPDQFKFPLEAGILFAAFRPVLWSVCPSVELVPGIKRGSNHSVSCSAEINNQQKFTLPLSSQDYMARWLRTSCLFCGLVWCRNWICRVQNEKSPQRHWWISLNRVGGTRWRFCMRYEEAEAVPDRARISAMSLEFCFNPFCVLNV